MKTTTGRRRKTRKAKRAPGRPAKAPRRAVNVRLDEDLHRRLRVMQLDAVTRGAVEPTFSFSDVLNGVLRQALGSEGSDYCRHGRTLESQCERCAEERLLDAIAAEKEAKAERARARKGQ